MIKKLWIFLLLVMISPMFSCENDSNSNEFNHASLLFLLGDKTLTVNVTYNGAYDFHGTYPGTRYIYVYLYNTRPVYTRPPNVFIMEYQPVL